MLSGTSWRSRLAAILISIPAALPAQGKVPTFRTEQYATGSSLYAVQADLNQDGALDFVVGNEIWLSNGDGTYRSGGVVSARGEGIATGDFDADSHADLVFVNSGAVDFQIAYGRGDGTFRTVVDYPGVPLSGGNYIDKAVAADFNRDGKLDLAVFTTDIVTGYIKRIYTLINTGTTFTPQGPWAVETAFHNPITGNDDHWDTRDFVLGDFDSDGNADVAYSVVANVDRGPIHSRLIALFGNGTAVLGNPVVVKDSDGAFPVTAADLNQDARTDLVGAYWGAPSCQTDCAGFDVFYGTSARSFTERKSPNQKTFVWQYPVVADFNGDHRLDVALIAMDPPNNTFGIGVGTQNADGAISAQPYYSLGPFPQVRDLVPARFLLGGDYDRNGKPDLMTISDTGDKTLFIALNVTSAPRFPSCLHSGAQGVHVCSPAAGATVQSPVPFKVGASNFTPLRKVEVWVDGKKRKETFFSYSIYSYMDTKISMTAGSHTVSVFAVGYDSDWIKDSFTIQVAP